ncbi:ACAP2 [Symbiodinium pilosum]|uniref:ACAP2 protein n=1 Tax=Symbiodinium pilosum TaxID=2952 RepID=A0A812NW84_SYMPI|nr:ACAP2 [Symbiodinium pilosum]
MLKWSGDYSLPRLRAKLATTGAGTEQTEPDYAEVYRPDLGQSTILRKESPEFFAAVAETGGFEAFARSSGCNVLKKASRSPLAKTGSFAGRTTLGQSFGQTTFTDLNQTSMTRTRSVPTLGSRSVEKWPAAVEPLPPTWHVASTSSLPGLAKSTSRGSLLSRAIPTPPAADDAKEKQVEAACKKLWTAVHGSEKYIKDEIKRLHKEEPGVSNQAFLAKLNKADANFPSIKKALKTGAKIDWKNPEWDGATLLIRAARTGSLELAKFCLSQAANITERDNSGRGVLHWTALSGNNELMQYFLTEYREQLNVAQEDGGGDSPLHLGAYAGQLGVVRLLIRADARETQNAGGFTPTQLAEARRMWHVVRHLRENQNDDVVKERLGHILRYNKSEEAEEEDVPLRELVFRPCNIEKADQLIALQDD